jgi:hypothetical protein
LGIDSRKYLTNIADIVNSLQWAKLKAEMWCEDREIEDPTVVANCVVMAMMWGAALRDHPLTHTEVLNHLGFEETSQDDIEETFWLHPELQELSFDELMETTAG